MKVINSLSKLFPEKIAYAHCDIPCGIYDPKSAQIAAATVLKMVQLINSLPTEGSPEEMVPVRNNFVRMVLVKEEHARKCKEEILILWTDYFKKEDLEIFPDLHEIFWGASKLCSKVKQEVSEEAAQELIKAVDKIAEMFQKKEEAKKVKK